MHCCFTVEELSVALRYTFTCICYNLYAVKYIDLSHTVAAPSEN
jgi:hypothetical protein